MKYMLRAPRNFVRNLAWTENCTSKAKRQGRKVKACEQTESPIYSKYSLHNIPLVRVQQNVKYTKSLIHLVRHKPKHSLKYVTCIVKLLAVREGGPDDVKSSYHTSSETTKAGNKYIYYIFMTKNSSKITLIHKC